MKDHHIKLTKTDREILHSYELFMEGLSAYLGEGYELVLHSLEDYSSSAVKVIHGLHTGRSEGAPLTDLALSLLDEMDTQEDTQNGSLYFTNNKKGESLRSTTIPIRGSNNRIIGLLCINFNLNTPFSEYIKNFIPGNDLVPQRTESFPNSGLELLEDIVSQLQEEVTADKSISSANRNKEIITRLYEKGVYNMKDAVTKTAKLLGISKNTVYMHLRNL